MQSRNGNIPIASDELAADEAPDDARMWYARLRIRDDRLAKLWAWKLAEHDVIVWSESDERWKQLLAVPELRAAVRKATTSAYARKSTPPPALPSAQSGAPNSSTRRRHLQTVADFEGDELTTRVSRNSLYPDEMDMEPTAVTYARPALHPASSAPPPPPVELLRALTTTIPPAVHGTPAVEFPRAPKVPSISEKVPSIAELARATSIHPSSTSDQGSNSSSFLPPPIHSDFREIGHTTGSVPHATYSQPPPPSAYPSATYPQPPPPSAYLAPAAISSRPPPPSALQRLQPSQLAARAQYIVARPRSQLTTKNLSWAMLPIACAGVFAIFLDRYLPKAQSAPVAIIEAPSESTSGPIGSWLGAMLGMSLGRAQPTQAAPPQQLAQQPPPNSDGNLTPEQLAPVAAAATKPWTVGHGTAPSRAAAWKGTVAKAAAPSAAKAEEKASAQSSNAAPANAAAAGTNESFDRDGARTALKFAVARVRNCSNSGVTGSALITFGPSGTVQKVQISQMVGDDVDASCVNRALASARVPPFTGAPVTVRKAF